MMKDYTSHIPIRFDCKAVREDLLPFPLHLTLWATYITLHEAASCIVEEQVPPKLVAAERSQVQYSCGIQNSRSYSYELPGPAVEVIASFLSILSF